MDRGATVLDGVSLTVTSEAGANLRETRVASILVRNLPDDAKERLRRRAMRHKRSLEAEVRAILARAAQEPVVPTDQPEPFPTGSSA